MKHTIDIHETYYTCISMKHTIDIHETYYTCIYMKHTESMKMYNDSNVFDKEQGRNCFC